MNAFGLGADFDDAVLFWLSVSKDVGKAIAQARQDKDPKWVSRSGSVLVPDDPNLTASNILAHHTDSGKLA